jgi:hypothetical protein
MRLHQHAVDIVDVNVSVGCTNGLDHAADAEIAGLPQNAVGGTDDQVDGRLSERVVSQSDTVEFAQNEVTHAVGTQAFADNRIGNPTFDILVDTKFEIGQQAGLPDEDKVVILGEVLEEESQLAQVGQVHEVGVVEDGGQALAGVVEAEGLLDEPAFALEGGTFELNAEGVAEDFDGIGVGVQSSGDGGDEVLVFGESLQRLFDDGLTGAGNAENQAQSALLTMDLERVVNFLLLRQQQKFTSVKGIVCQAVEGSDHGCSFLRFMPLATASRSRAAPMRWPL